MAAFYSGIHLKLKSSQTPWEDKLKLARFAWVSSQCLLPNKEQVLLDWCTHALTRRYTQKVEFSENVLEGLWFYLDDLLHSRKLHSLLKQGKVISLRLTMAQLLLDRLQECARVGPENTACVSTILSVCQGLLSSPALSSVFTTKYELIVDLLAKFCALACRELQQPLLAEPPTTESGACQDEEMAECLPPQPASDLDGSQNEPIAENSPDHPTSDANRAPPKPTENTRSANVFDVLLQVLHCYLSVQRQQANPNRVFTMVTNQLIQPLTLLRHLLTSGEFAPSHTHLGLRQQLSRDIRIKIDATLQLALFPSEHLTSYTEELLPAKGDSGKRPKGVKCPLKPVTAILSKLSARGSCEPPLHYAVKSNTLSLLYKFFLESYAKKRGSEEAPRMLCFYFLARLVPVLDFLVKSSSQDASLTLPFTVPTVTSMTSLLRQGEGLIGNPHHVILVLGALQLLPLDHLSPSVYQAVFLAVHEALFAIIQCHPQVMLNAAPSFLNVFYRLVASIMQEGRQRGDSDTDGDVYLQCARLIERMYSHIAATSENFTKLSAFMVAQYVTELQKVTLRPDVKLHLTEGIYRILDLCGEQDIKFLVAGLQMGVRVVFNELYTSYTHYHKAQRQGEDKYTV
ncbi:Unhealthy ribosome biogenesis protein 2 [Liparis tanakae]|uniref:Unhealthy ribosome biogenesis protein 2 n=1 Tax=Liparis tanakae TaxID=230148 RepID=A0A4Z2GT74_9TELE|nr:Unhealthy ribosome biogenesis protein 2 [Liparis tanakae]